MKRIVVIIIFTLLCMPKGISGQNTINPNIGIIPKITGENLLLINANTGSIESFTSTGEEIYAASVNGKEHVFYFLTLNHVYKGDVTSGDILEKYTYNELDEDITPYDITTEGIAIYAKKENGSKETVSGGFGFFGADEEETTEKKEAEKPESHKLFIADNNTKTTSFLYDITPSNIYYEGLAEKTVYIKDSNTGGRSFLSVKTKKIVKEEAAPTLTPKYQELSQYKNPYVSYNNKFNLYYYNYNGKEGKGSLQIIYDLKKDKIILYNKDSTANHNRFNRSLFIAGYNASDTSYFVYKRVRKVKLPPFPKEEDYNLDKLEELERYSKDVDSVANISHKINFNPHSFSFVIYSTPEFNKVAEIPKVNIERGVSGSVKVYDNKYALIDRKTELELYNLETKETVWIIDTDF